MGGALLREALEITGMGLHLLQGAKIIPVVSRPSDQIHLVAGGLVPQVPEDGLTDGPPLPSRAVDVPVSAQVNPLIVVLRASLGI